MNLQRGNESFRTEEEKQRDLNQEDGFFARILKYSSVNRKEYICYIPPITRDSHPGFSGLGNYVHDSAGIGLIAIAREFEMTLREF